MVYDVYFFLKMILTITDNSVNSIRRHNKININKKIRRKVTNMKYGERYAYTVIAVIAVVTVFFGFMIPKINMDNELRHFFPDEHPSNIRFKQLTTDFGDQYAMDIVLETNEDTILRPDYIAAIKNISEELALLANVVKVRSLTDIEFITAMDGALVVETTTRLSPLRPRSGSSAYAPSGCRGAG